MRRSFKAYHTNISFIDLLFNTVLGLVVFFTITFMLVTIQKTKEESNIKTKAEIVITMTWDDKSNDDIDLWVRDPEGKLCFFRNKDVNMMHLDRDDLGNNDTLITADGREIVSVSRQEITTIRGFIPGEWVINAQMYNKRETTPAHIKIRIQKLNPSVTLIDEDNFILNLKGDEHTVARIVMGADGAIMSVDKLPCPIASQELVQGSEGMGQ
jgi:hypothetical protein